MNIFIPKIFKEILIEKAAPFKTFYSGRSAAKSHSIARALLFLGIKGPLRIVCGRQFMASIRDSVKSLMDDIAYNHNLDHFYSSSNNMIIGRNGTRITFIGLDRSIQSVKGLEGVDIFWIEEAQTLTQESIDILIPTIRRNKGSEIWISMNPELDTDPAYQQFIVKPRPNSIVKKVSFLENPWVDEGTLEEAAWCELTQPKRYGHIWLGECSDQSEHAIFTNWKIGNVTEEGGDGPYYGMDFGMSDPTTVIKMVLYPDKRELHILDEAYKTNVELDDLVDFIKTVDGAFDNYIVADSSRPETIKFLNARGAHIMSSKKGAGSVLEGIKWLQNWSIIIHPKCKYTIDEFRTYQWEVEKKTNMPKLNKPEDKNNHLIDAIRYASEICRNKGHFC